MPLEKGGRAHKSVYTVSVGTFNGFVGCKKFKMYPTIDECLEPFKTS